MKLALYIRTSTAEQNPDLQERELRSYAQAMGHEIEGVYAEVASGASDKRPVLKDLMADARAHKFQAVVCWKLDRFGRSMIDLIENIRELDRCGIRFLCPRQGIDTDHQAAEGRLLLHLLAAFAEFERAIIRDRVGAGRKRYEQDLAAGRVGAAVHSKSGKDLAPHRPRVVFDREQVRRLRAEKQSIRQIARALHIGRSTVERTLKGANTWQ